MADFDPSTYLAQVKAKPGPQFDPDQYLGQVGSPMVTPDSADKASRPKQQYMSPGESATNNVWTNIKARITDPDRYKAILGLDSPAKPDTVGGLGSAAYLTPIEAVPSAIANIAKYLGKPGFMPGVARAAANTGIGAAQGALENPDDRLGGAMKSGGLALGLGTGAEILGASGGRIQDYLMQKAAGMKKIVPGVGTEMANQGLIGTKGIMRGQAQDAINNLGSQASEQISSIPGQINSSEAAQPLNEYASGLKVGDQVPGHSVSEYTGAVDRASEIANRGSISPEQAWEYSKRAGAAGYKNQKAMQSEAAYLAQAEQQGYSETLKNAATTAGGESAGLPDTFDKLSKMYKASSALREPTTISSIALPTLVGGAAGYGKEGNIAGALKGAALGMALKSGLAPSIAGRGAGYAGKLGSLFANPAMTQSVVKQANEK